MVCQDEAVVLVGLILGGVAAMALVLWSRGGRTHRARWWADKGTGDALDERLVLFFLPGIALGLWGFALLYDFSGSQVQWWRLPALPALLLGFVLIMWGGLQLPVPRWYLPAWLRRRRR